MRHLTSIITAICMLSVLSACHSDHADALLEAHEMTFVVKNIRQYASMQEEEASITKTLDHLVFFLYDKQRNERVKGPLLQHAGEGDFGHFTCSLIPGDYRLTVIGYFGKQDEDLIDLHNNTFGFKDGSVPLTYLSSADYTVKGDDEVKTIALKRAVAGLQYMLTDSIPEWASFFVIKTHGGSNQTNCLLGSAADNEGRTHTIRIPARLIGKKDVVLTSYIYLSHAEDDVDVTISAYNAEMKEMYRHTYQAVRLGRNRLSLLKDRFFTTSNNVSGEKIWEEDLGQIWH